jgi:hypothetical protein
LLWLFLVSLFALVAIFLFYASCRCWDDKPVPLCPAFRTLEHFFVIVRTFFA